LSPSDKHSNQKLEKPENLKEEATKNRRMMKKRGIRRLDATSSHLLTNWKEFEIAFRRACKIKAMMTSVSWMENNHQKPNESIAAFVTRVQNAVATTSREALTNKANDINEKDKPKWTDHT
jgi:hypothetical protein